jgi:hypothetical protein
MIDRAEGVSAVLANPFTAAAMTHWSKVPLVNKPEPNCRATFDWGLAAASVQTGVWWADSQQQLQ